MRPQADSLRIGESTRTQVWVRSYTTTTLTRLLAMQIARSCLDGIRLTFPVGGLWCDGKLYCSGVIVVAIAICYLDISRSATFERFETIPRIHTHCIPCRLRHKDNLPWLTEPSTTLTQIWVLFVAGQSTIPEEYNLSSDHDP